MFRKKNLFQILAVSILTFCVFIYVSAQKTGVENITLAKFEKNIEQGNYAAIERDLLNYAIANPNNASAFELLGRLRSGQNRAGEAKSLFQKALSLNPKLISAKINLAVINFQIGNLNQAVLDLGEVSVEDVSNDSLRLDLARAFALIGDCPKALNIVEKFDVKIKNSDALPVRAGCYLAAGERQKIDSLILPAKSQAKQNPVLAIKFAEVLSNGAMYKESADVLRSVILSAPNNADALILLAKAEIYLKDLATARIHLKRASKINPQSPELLFTESLLESEQGNAAQALDLLEKLLTANPNSTIFLSQLVVTAMRAEQAGKAFRAAEKLMELKPDEPEFVYLYGAAALQNKNLPAAENSLKRFVELRSQDSRGCLALGLTYALQPDKLEDARVQLKHCVETNPNNYEAKYQLGLSYKTQGEIGEAIAYLEDTVRISPNYALALRDLGAVYLQSGAETKARTVLEKAIAINPNDSDTHFQLSRLYNLIGEKDLAKKHLEIFQKLKNPNKNGM